MKLQTVRVEIITEADAPTLMASVNTFLATASLREFISIHYQISATEHCAMIVYTE